MNATNVHPEDFVDVENGFSGWRLKLQHNRAIPTPAFHDGKLYVAGGFGSYDFYCVDAKSGIIAWQHRCPDDGPTAPVVASNRVFYNTESCTLEALDLEGVPLWRHWLGDPMLAQPAAAGDLVFAVYPKNDNHRLSAFRANDGTPLWDHDVGGDVISAPVAANGHVYLATFDGVVRCVDAETGRLQWSKAMQATSAPWVQGDQVYASHRVEDIHRENGAKSPRECTSRIDPCGGASKAYDAKDAHYLDPEHGGARKSALGGAADSSVGFGSAPGAAKLEQASRLIGEDKVSRAWRFQGSRPVVAYDIVFDTTGDRLEACDAETGELRWQWSAGQGIEGERKLTPPVVAGGSVWIGTWDGRLLSWDAITGRLRWKARLPAPCHWQPVVADGWVYVGLEDGSLVALDTHEETDARWTAWGGGAGHNGPESSETVQARSDGMFELPLNGLNGHIVADVNGSMFLVDTGSPLSFGLDASGTAIRALEALIFDFRSQPLPEKVLQGIASAIHKHVSEEIRGVLGMDVLSRFDVCFSLSRGRMTFSRSAALRDGDFALPLELCNGLPIIGPVGIARRDVPAVWDSGAPTGYLVDPGLFTGSEYVGEREDFHPLSCTETFRVDVHSVPVEMGPQGGMVRLQMALLPDWIDSGGHHILGVELLNHFDVSLCWRDGVARFTRHHNLA